MRRSSLLPPLGGASSRVKLLSDRHRTGVAGARPGSQQQQKPRMRARHDFVALGRGELDQQARAAGHVLAARARHLNLAVDYHDPRPLVNLVVWKGLARPEVKGDRPRLGGRGQDLGETGLEVERVEVPALHDGRMRDGLVGQLAASGDQTAGSIGAARNERGQLLLGETESSVAQGVCEPSRQVNPSATPGCRLTPIAVGLVAAHDGCVFGLEIPTRVPGFAEELELIAPNQGLRGADFGIAQRRITEGKNS
jgi:hypothetical protein